MKHVTLGEGIDSGIFDGYNFKYPLIGGRKINMPKQVTNEDLAVMIKNGFDNTASKQELSEVKSDVDRLETSLERVETKIDKALHVEYINLEVRVKRIEQHIGLKAAK